jgi:hypothetical protein
MTHGASQQKYKSLRNNNRAVSPAISTVLMTSAIVVMVLVSMVYAQTFLDTRMSENEFNTNKQFMTNTGFQIDDVAWTLGRTQTIRYTATYGHVAFQPEVITYRFEILAQGNSDYQEIFTNNTGAILYNMPVTKFTLGNNYLERVLPASNGSFLQVGASASATHVYVIEKLPMDSGSYARVVVAPSIRMLNSPIGDRNYVKFYLPLLTAGESPHLSSSVTLTGEDVTQYLYKNVVSVRITVDFPVDTASAGFDSSFFPFENDLSFGHYQVIVNLPSTSVIAFYVGEVSVSLGLHA